MKSMFDRNFRNSFTPKMGQDDSPFITSYEQGPPSSGDIPGLYTSVDQGPPSSGPIPGLVTQQDLQETLKTPTPATDWGKLALALVKGAGESYSAYARAQATFDIARAKAGLPPMPIKTAAAASSGISPNVVFLVGGIAAAALIAVVAAS